MQFNQYYEFYAVVICLPECREREARLKSPAYLEILYRPLTFVTTSLARYYLSILERYVNFRIK